MSIKVTIQPIKGRFTILQKFFDFAESTGLSGRPGPSVKHIFPIQHMAEY